MQAIAIYVLIVGLVLYIAWDYRRLTGRPWSRYLPAAKLMLGIAVVLVFLGMLESLGPLGWTIAILFCLASAERSY